MLAMVVVVGVCDGSIMHFCFPFLGWGCSESGGLVVDGGGGGWREVMY